MNEPIPPAVLSPLIAGAWDGCSAWLQWNPVCAEGYRLRVRIRPKADAPWGKWLAIGGAEPLRKAWRVVQMTREGWQMQAQVAPAGEDPDRKVTLRPEAWETATEVALARSTARFAFARAASVKAMEVLPGTIFSAMVDLAGCSYVLNGLDALILQPGTTTAFEMEAAHLSAWCQLDAPGKAWRVVPMTREGWQMQAQVAVAATEVTSVPQWETATEVTLARSTARFAFARAASVKAIEVLPGTIFSAMVDFAGCSYVFAEPDALVLQPGTTTECELEAAHLSAWCQLDAPGDFLARPVVGLTVTNTTPSENDVAEHEDPATASDLALIIHRLLQ